jgi:dihydroneopterin aldolase/D-erythro-7,8-dihydroneopterin triphosphate epimerase
MERLLDRIEVQDLLLRCIIGINDSERRNKQDVVINIILWADLAKAAAADDIEATVNYRTLTKQVIEHVEKSSYFLVEALAEHIAGICLQYGPVRRVQVSVNKPSALRFARSVGVVLQRERPD